MKAEYTFTINDYRELQRKRFVIHLFTILLGATGIAISLCFYLLAGYDKLWMILFTPSLMFFGIGVIFEGAIAFTFHRIKDVKVKFVYEFFDKELKAMTYDGKKKTSETILEYKMIRKQKVTKHCLFLFLPNKKVLPLSITDPNIEEIKRLIEFNDIPKKKI